MATSDERMLRQEATLPAPDDYDVIVIGAGVSGLRAASDMKSLYGLKVLVLEARDKIGG